MRATALVRVAHVHGRDEVVERRAAAPLAIRSSGGRVLLASTAATPVGGDELDVGVVVEPGASADIGSVAAMMLWPGPCGSSSVLRTECDVGAGGHLDLRPEPTVSVVGSSHRSLTRIRLATGASCRIVEEISLGRTGEPSGDLVSSLRLERAGAVLVHHDERFGPGHPGAATSVGIGAARHVLTAVVVGLDPGPAAAVVEPGRAASRLPLTDDALMVLAVGHDRPTVRELVAELVPELLVRSRTTRYGGGQLTASAGGR